MVQRIFELALKYTMLRKLCSYTVIINTIYLTGHTSATNKGIIVRIIDQRPVLLSIHQLEYVHNNIPRDIDESFAQYISDFTDDVKIPLKTIKFPIILYSKLL